MNWDYLIWIAIGVAAVVFLAFIYIAIKEFGYVDKKFKKDQREADQRKRISSSAPYTVFPEEVDDRSFDRCN
jgi:hypothetical protein